MPGSAARQGFSLVELLVVMGIMLILGGAVFAGVGSLLANNQRQQTQQIIAAVLTEMENWPQDAITLSDGSVRKLWDIDVDLDDLSDSALDTAVTELDKFVIDGDPALAPLGSALAVRAPKNADGTYAYRGFAVATGFRAEHVDELGQVLDAWRQPLHILWSRDRFGNRGIGVWSIGADGISDPFTAGSDDIRSWNVE